MARDTPNDCGLLLQRLGYASLLIGFHGWARFLRAFNLAVHHQPWPFVTNVVQRMGLPHPSAFAVLSAMAESIAALFVGFGLFTRWAAFIVAFNMGVALFFELRLSTDPKPELPALYLLGAVVILVLGGGRFSLGAMLGRRRR